MKNSLETNIGFFVAIAIGAAVIIVEKLGDFDIFAHNYHVSGLFNSAQDLKVGDRVKMAGVEIGTVDDIELTTNKVKVLMKLRDSAMVKTDSKATIKFTGLMGQNFVAIDFGSPTADKAADGTILETAEQPDLSAIMAKLDEAASGIKRVGDSFSGDKIDNILGPLTDLMKQNSTPITATIANIKNITSQVAAGQGTIGKMIYQDELYASAMGTVSNLHETAISLNTVINNVKSGQGTIGKMITDDALYDSTKSSMTNLNQILIKINQGNGTLGKLVNDQEFYKNAKLSLQKLDKAADGLEDTGPLTVIGEVVGNLF